HLHLTFFSFNPGITASASHNCCHHHSTLFSPSSLMLSFPSTSLSSLSFFFLCPFLFRFCFFFLHHSPPIIYFFLRLYALPFVFFFYLFIFLFVFFSLFPPSTIHSEQRLFCQN